MKFVVEKQMYAIGGVLTCFDSIVRCFLIDFIGAKSQREAGVLALKEVIQFIVS